MRANQIFKVFLKLGLTSFGGPTAHIGYFRKEFVEQRKWLSEAEFAQLLAICQFLPGPASSQLGFGIGLLKGGGLGALAAFTAFTLPSACLMLLAALLLPYTSGQTADVVIQALKLVAVVVVADALFGMWKNLCPDRPRQIMALASAAVLLSADTVGAQMLIIAAAAVVGAYALRTSQDAQPDTQVQGLHISYSNRLGWVFAALFVLIFVSLPLLSAWHPTLALADTFYRAGALVFGGGHVVLPLLENAAVQQHAITEAEFLAGYGAAQAMPGPLFTLSAYLGALADGTASPVAYSVVALLFIFLPGFLLLLAALPLWHKLAGQPRAANMVAGVNAAVVGILGAALYNPLFTSSVVSSMDAAIVVLGLGLLRIGQFSPLWVILWCLVASTALHLI